ncbi:helix-turn-helix domain-containing protein [Bacillus sp. CMF12]|uniref:helix-turn-helix transcriptional regulator n=1 Tax=Bacillus sp. CMF12 TaxID=2884834 RepID=UPI00207A0C49|nr:helix-turn-helix domain-containing protein [Bacillus sp. CMF12]
MIMVEQGRTQKWLGEKVGASNRTISEIINEKREPTLKIALRIAKAIEEPVEKIWWEEEN